MFESRVGDNNRKCVVLLSGGIDSSTLLYRMEYDGYECHPITIMYGQTHRKELDAAERICRELGLDWKLFDLRVLGGMLPSALTGKGEIPNGHYTDETMKQTVVPNRNMILLSVAVGYAQGIGAGIVAYAAHSGDHYVYPDCRPSFINAMELAITEGTEGQVDLYTPYVSMYKWRIVWEGSKLGVPFELTYSCYKGGERHCGRCGTCVERKEAFKLAGVKDPTIYEE